MARKRKIPLPSPPITSQLSDEGEIASSNPHIAHILPKLLHRIQYAHFKVTHGWESHTLPQVIQLFEDNLLEHTGSRSGKSDDHVRPALQSIWQIYQTMPLAKDDSLSPAQLALKQVAQVEGLIPHSLDELSATGSHILTTSSINDSRDPLLSPFAVKKENRIPSSPILKSVAPTKPKRGRPRSSTTTMVSSPPLTTTIIQQQPLNTLEQLNAAADALVKFTKVSGNKGIQPLSPRIFRGGGVEDDVWGQFIESRPESPLMTPKRRRYN